MSIDFISRILGLIIFGSLGVWLGIYLADIFGGLVTLTFIVIISFAILNVFFGQGEELVEKMKKEEARIAEANKLSKIISSLPSGILTFYEGSDHYKLSKEQ